jgi:hypothetical protein
MPRIPVRSSRAETHDGAAAADRIDGGPHLPQERRVTVGHADHQRTDADRLRRGRQCGKRGHALELRPRLLGPLIVHDREVVLVPDGLEANLLGEPRHREHPPEGVFFSVSLDLQAETHRQLLPSLTRLGTSGGARPRRVTLAPMARPILQQLAKRHPLC